MLEKKGQKTIIDLTAFKRAVALGLRKRLIGWEDNRNFVIATVLDPRYKFTILDLLHMISRDKYRLWLEEEAQEVAQQLFEYSHIAVSRQNSGSVTSEDDIFAAKNLMHEDFDIPGSSNTIQTTSNLSQESDWMEILFI